MKNIYDQAALAAKTLVHNYPELVKNVHAKQASVSDIAMRFQMELFDQVWGDHLPKDPGREA